ncbi:hypothetical protein LCGC14_1065580 [marine sediment metagenome]|uniref:Uncharacterized protein n=1 Tax=marine sediment metagenome TaxID=412755 RepID=A0A0F9MPL6_9ZZZZ
MADGLFARKIARGPFRGYSPSMPQMGEVVVLRLAVTDGRPLTPGTGLYVHHPAEAGPAYYAVVTAIDGTANTRAFAALAEPVAEKPGRGRPVLQRVEDLKVFYDFPGERRRYVQWCAPPLSPRPNMYFNWTVMLPPDCVDDSGWLKKDVAAKSPAEVYFHSRYFSHAKPRQKYLLDSIQIAPHDYPPSGWYGYNDAAGTGRPLGRGTVGNHTQQRIIAFLDWAKTALPIDPDRIIPVGADGAAMLAIAYPDTFAYVLINKFSNVAVSQHPAASLIRAWGPRSREIKDAEGRSEWGWAMMDQVLLASRGRDLPLIFCKGYSWGPYVRGFAKGEGRFYTAMQKANQPIMADWTWASGKLLSPDSYTGLWRGLDITRTTPVPAMANCSTNSNRESNGNVNLPITWQPVEEGPGKVQVALSSRSGGTLDLALRRLGKFRVKPGQTLLWEATSAKPRRGETPEPQSGKVAVDRDGLFVLKGLKIARGCELTVKVTRSR